VAEVWFHPDARVEYLDALAWYEARSPRAAARFEEEVENIINLIGSNPTLFPK
jgi:hypothetical protein